jgi:hypothetical protein
MRFLAFLARPPDEFPTAIGTDAVHGSCALCTECTFERADKGNSGKRECLLTLFALRFHLKRH